MWAARRPAAWEDAVLFGATVVHRVEIRSAGSLLATVTPKGGSVTADFETGVRRTLSAVFGPDESPRLTPGVELHVFSGFDYGSGSPDLVPMGVFPLTQRDMTSAAGEDVQVSAMDRWQWVTDATFPAPWSTVPGRTIRSEIVRLFAETGMWSAGQVQVAVTSSAVARPQSWDQDRSQAIADLCDAVGAEAFIDRTGSPVVRDRRAPTAAVVTISGGFGGRLVQDKVSIDIGQVFNAVSVVSANTDPAFVIPPVKVVITDRHHKAYPRPGVVPLKTFRVDGGQFSSTTQAKAAAQKILSRISRAAEQVTVMCLPDPGLDESDTVIVDLPLGGSRTAQIGQITYPMAVTELQQITTVSTRSDEDFKP